MHLSSPPDLPPTAGYSHVAVIPPGSTLVQTSGQVPMAPDGTLAPAGDWEAQTRLVFENLTRALAGGGATWRDVFKLTVYVVSLDGLAEFRRVRDAFVDTTRPPTSSLVQVAGLVRPEFLIEVEAVAAVAPAGDAA
jgi:enamine deaminase RidA (YjgF/YER057c/UK114 family)